jgi:hypothetical protein
VIAQSFCSWRDLGFGPAMNCDYCRGTRSSTNGEPVRTAPELLEVAFLHLSWSRKAINRKIAANPSKVTTVLLSARSLDTKELGKRHEKSGLLVIFPYRSFAELGGQRERPCAPSHRHRAARRRNGAGARRAYGASGLRPQWSSNSGYQGKVPS